MGKLKYFDVEESVNHSGDAYSAEELRLNEKRLENDVKIKKLMEKIELIKSLPREREISGEMSARNAITQVGICTFATGSLAYGLCKYLVTGNIDERILPIVGLAGINALMSVINSVCYKEKPLTNAFHDILIHTKEKKIKKLEKENQDIEYMGKIFSCHTYEDMSNSTDEHMCVEDMDR